jgi:hypothetical protein
VLARHLDREVAGADREIEDRAAVRFRNRTTALLHDQ